MHEFSEFDPAALPWLVRAYHTPLSDALRGQLSGRLDVRREIAAANLPAPLAGLIYTVVRRGRLWRSEQFDVARELIAHFADGLAAGRPAEQLAADFGPPDQAARLIRRAKLRARPLWWQSYRIGSRLLLLILVVSASVYAALAARFFLGKSVVAHNYWHDINAARRVPEAEAAWPLYREALIALGEKDARSVSTDWLNHGPTGKHWDETMAILARHSRAIELTRQGAKKRHLGYLWGDPADRNAARAASASWLIGDDAPLADANQDLLGVYLSGPQELRDLGRLILSDARRAALAGDGATALADLDAIIAMSAQLFPPNASLVEQLIGMALFRHSMEVAGQILADTPAVFTDDQLRDLAHRLAAYRGGDMTFDFGAERMAFDDLLQRAYTDDGHGNGRITREGALFLLDGGNAAVSEMSASGGKNKSISALLPGMAAFVGSRQENRALYNKMFDDMIAMHQGDPWKWESWQFDDRIAQLGDSRGSLRLRYGMVALMLPGLSGVFNAVQRSIQVRDACEVVIALELFHRRHGQWPQSLDQLVPDLLPTVPPDRFDGQSLRYVVRDGNPILYSVGVNRADDGGNPTPSPDWASAGPYGRLAPAYVKSYRDSDYQGDWILWPPIVQPEEEE